MLSCVQLQSTRVVLVSSTHTYPHTECMYNNHEGKFDKLLNSGLPGRPFGLPCRPLDFPVALLDFPMHGLGTELSPSYYAPIRIFIQQFAAWEQTGCQLWTRVSGFFCLKIWFLAGNRARLLPPSLAYRVNS